MVSYHYQTKHLEGRDMKTCPRCLSLMTPSTWEQKRRYVNQGKVVGGEKVREHYCPTCGQIETEYGDD